MPTERSFIIEIFVVTCSHCLHELTQLKMGKIKALTRPYAQAVAGSQVVLMNFNPKTTVYQLIYVIDQVSLCITAPPDMSLIPQSIGRTSPRMSPRST